MNRDQFENNKPEIQKYNNLDFHSLSKIAKKIMIDNGLSVIDMARVFDTSISQISFLINGYEGYLEVSPDLYGKLIYYSKSKDELIDLCRSKRSALPKSDSDIIINTINDMLKISGYDVEEVAYHLHIEPDIVEAILNNDFDYIKYIAYPTDKEGRDIFNNIITGNFKIRLDKLDIPDLDEKQIKDINEAMNDNIQENINSYNDNNKLEYNKLEKVNEICDYLKSNYQNISENNIKRLKRLISNMAMLEDDGNIEIRIKFGWDIII